MRRIIYRLCGFVLLASSCAEPVTIVPTNTPSRVTPVRVLPMNDTPAPPTQTRTPPSVPSATPSLTAIPVQTATVSTAAQYAFPIAQGAVSYGKDHHDYPATDIFCDEGSTFVAVTDGVIDSIVGVDRWDSTTDVPADRSGRAVALIGDDGVRYYGSHLSAIAPGLTVGQRVRVGTLLGYTGKSGNARFTPPHLHFGISQPTTPDDWQIRRGQISPYPYLTAWAQGESLTPLLDQ